MAMQVFGHQLHAPATGLNAVRARRRSAASCAPALQAPREGTTRTSLLRPTVPPTPGTCVALKGARWCSQVETKGTRARITGTGAKAWEALAVPPPDPRRSRRALRPELRHPPGRAASSGIGSRRNSEQDRWRLRLGIHGWAWADLCENLIHQSIDTQVRGPHDRRKPCWSDLSRADINRQDEALRRIKSHVKATKTPGVLSDLGLFGGLFAAKFEEARPILVSSMDGVGTKMKFARLAGKWDTVGQDLVNHCINDILVQGARPLFFLDYIAAQKLEPEIIEQIVKGMAEACKATGCALIGGEMAEMPGVYEAGEVDVAGTIVGLVDEADLLPRLDQMFEGDVLIGLPSSGLHTNGYSLARKVLFEVEKRAVDSLLPATGTTVGAALLAVHRCYLDLVMPFVKARRIRGMAHITGGGLTDNLPRVLPKHLDAEIDTRSWEIPGLFRHLIKASRLPIEDARRCLNLGVGMVPTASDVEATKIVIELRNADEQAWILGRLARAAER